MTSNVIQVNIPKAMAMDWLAHLSEYFTPADPVVHELSRALRETGIEYTHVLVSLSQSDMVIIRRALMHHELALTIDLSRIALDIKQLDDFALLSTQRYGHRDGTECNHDNH